MSHPSPGLADQSLTPLQYAVYGVLCAARRESGEQGARRLYRIQERIDNWDDGAVRGAILALVRLGWVKECDDNPIMGMWYFEIVDQ